MTKKNKDMKKETKENLELLLKDLCGRLPYNVICRKKWIAPMTKSPEQTNKALSPRDLEAIQSLIEHGIAYVNLSDGREIFLDKYEFKPYLRPLYSMTEDEARFILKFILGDQKVYMVNVTKDGIEAYVDDDVASFEKNYVFHNEIVRSLDIFDYLNERQFDYRGLIENGLALKAEEGMY